MCKRAVLGQKPSQQVWSDYLQSFEGHRAQPPLSPVKVTGLTKKFRKMATTTEKNAQDAT